MIANKMT